MEYKRRGDGVKMVGQIKMNFKPLCHYAISNPTVCKTWAIKYLIDHLSDETMAEIANLIRENGKGWGVDHHHRFGTGVRNLLREGGFDWDPVDLDDLWVGLVGRAVRKNSDKPPNSEIRDLYYCPMVISSPCHNGS